MFIDSVKINIKGGNGGNGTVSFFRAKFITNGGPDGGDGGRGGSIIIKADSSLNTLSDLRYNRTYKADSGADGGARNCTGKSGEDLIIKVPLGTVVKEFESGKVMADMHKDGEEKLLIEGGKGGRGNQHFATARMQAPKYAEKGVTSKEYSIVLELKLIADVGIIGLPNVGKSTFLSMVTNANPKIDNYHFTTLSPNLGVVKSNWHEEFVLADIPGLIEGASDGKGLGHKFLRHIERTKMFLHVVDTSGLEGTDPIEGIEIINNELKKYNDNILKRPQIIAANKMDLVESQENFELLKAEMEKKGIPVYPISAATKTGLSELMTAIGDTLKNYPEDIVFEEEYEEYEEIEIDEEEFEIQIDDHVFYVTGAGIEKMLGYTSLDTERGFAFFQRYMREKGIIDKLKEMGIVEGDTVNVCDIEFDYY